MENASLSHAPQLLNVSVQIGGGGAGQVIGHAGPLVRAQRQDHRLAQPGQGQVPGVQAPVLRFQSQQNVVLDRYARPHFLKRGSITS